MIGLAALLSALAVESARGGSRGRAQELRGRLGLTGPASAVGLKARVMWVASVRPMSNWVNHILTRAADLAGVKLLSGSSSSIVETAPSKVTRLDPLVAWLAREAHLGHIVSMFGESDEVDEGVITQGAFYADFLTLLDWFEAESPDIMSYTAEGAVRACQEWSAQIRGQLGYRLPVRSGVTIASFPDGAKLVRLITNQDFIAEGASMGHCIGGKIASDGIPSGNSKYYRWTRDGYFVTISYRDPSGVPQATIHFPIAGLTSSQVAEIQGPDDGEITDALAIERVRYFVLSLSKDKNLPVSSTITHRLRIAGKEHRAAGLDALIERYLATLDFFTGEVERLSKKREVAVARSREAYREWSETSRYKRSERASLESEMMSLVETGAGVFLAEERARSSWVETLARIWSYLLANELGMAPERFKPTESDKRLLIVMNGQYLIPGPKGQDREVVMPYHLIFRIPSDDDNRSSAIDCRLYGSDGPTFSAWVSQRGADGELVSLMDGEWYSTLREALIESGLWRPMLTFDQQAESAARVHAEVSLVDDIARLVEPNSDFLSRQGLSIVRGRLVGQ